MPAIQRGRCASGSTPSQNRATFANHSKLWLGAHTWRLRPRAYTVVVLWLDDIARQPALIYFCVDQKPKPEALKRVINKSPTSIENSKL